MCIDICLFFLSASEQMRSICAVLFLILIVCQTSCKLIKESSLKIPHLTSEIFDSFASSIDETIDLEHLGIETLDADTFQNCLYPIKTLVLSLNSLSSLPNDVFQPISSTLVNLNLRNNQFNSNFFLINLPRLRVLDLSSNRLTSLSADQFKGLDQLETLILHKNHLMSLSSDNFRFCRNLTLLDLSDNQIIDVHPQSFNRLTHLKVLLFNNNPLGRYFPLSKQIFRPLVDLEYLDFENVELNSLEPFFFVSNQQLRTIKLRRNNFPFKSDLKQTFCSLQSIFEIDLVQTSIQTLDLCTFHQLPSLRRLYLMNNPLDCNCDLFYLRYGDLYRLLSRLDWFDNDFHLNRWINQHQLRKYLELSYENGDLKRLPIDLSTLARCSSPNRWANYELNNITGIYQFCRKRWFDIDRQCENYCQITDNGSVSSKSILFFLYFCATSSLFFRIKYR